jgi:hypothetical protein
VTLLQVTLLQVTLLQVTLLQVTLLQVTILQGTILQGTILQVTLLQLQAFLQKHSGVTDPIAIQFSKTLKSQIEKRFPNYGTDIKEFAIGNFFNPFYKGCFLRR